MGYFEDLSDNPIVRENTWNLPPIELPCGGKAIFDIQSGISYRCEHCMAVVGSVGQSQHCKDEAKFWEEWKKISGYGWDYQEGKPEERKKEKK